MARPVHHLNRPPTHGGADSQAREREVLDLADVIRLGPVFSAAEQSRAYVAAAHDRRLAVALGTAGYGLTQNLAGAPLLVGYTVADSLLEHARKERRYARVPAEVWEATILLP